MDTAAPEALIPRLREVAHGSFALFERQRRSYFETYAGFLAFFRSQERIDRNTVLLGASLVYSWMPRVLILDVGGLDESATILDAIRRGLEPSTGDLERLKKTINNSLVGAAKLVHFIAPERFPIWDSRVSRFLGWSQRLIGDVPTYQKYVSLCVAVAKLGAFTDIHARVEARLCPMDRLRAAELLMYLGGDPTATVKP